MRAHPSHSDTPGLSLSSSDPQPKPISSRRRAANRANAQHSTGPRTDEGKARSAMNAVRHGLAARASLLPGEDVAELQQLADEMQADFRPRSAIERELVGRVVSLTWRLRRIARAEETLWAEEDAERVSGHERWAKFTASCGIQNMPWDHDPTGAAPPAASGDQFLARQLSKAKSSSSALERLAVYEQRLDRALHAALRQLQQLRKMRERDDEEPDNDEHVAPVQNEPTAPATDRSCSRGACSPSDAGPHREQARGLHEAPDAPDAPSIIVQNEPTAIHVPHNSVSDNDLPIEPANSNLTSG